MNVCSCWKEYTKYVIKENESYSTSVQICNCTKEREECSCNGDVTKCNFYPEKRKEKKVLNTAEMWLQAQKDGLCYKMIISENNGEELFYQKNVGLFDGDGYVVELNNFGEFDDFMLNRWEVRIMTRAQAEAKFNIKIVA